MLRGDSFEGGHTGDPERDLAYERDYKRRGIFCINLTNTAKMVFLGDRRKFMLPQTLFRGQF